MDQGDEEADVSVQDAAGTLGVSDRQVRHLVSRGELFSPRRGRVDSASLQAYVSRRGHIATRVWAPITAWAALELMTGGTATWLGSSQRSRLRQELARIDAAGVVSRLRNRAEVRTYRVDPNRLPRVESQVAVVRSGDGALDGYLDESVLYRLVSSEQMVRTEPGNLTARVLPAEVGQDFAEVVIADGQVVAGVDLSTSTDPHEQRIGIHIVANALLRLR